MQNHLEPEIRTRAVEVFQSDELESIKRFALESILELDDHFCSEIDIFNGCIAWAKKNTFDGDLREALKHLFYLIPFCSMKMECFSEVASQNKALFKDGEIDAIKTFIGSKEQVDSLKLFKQSRSCVPSFNWNGENLVTCCRTKKEDSVEDDQVAIMVEEYTTFSASKKILFGGFTLFGFLNKSRNERNLLATIMISNETKATLDEFKHTFNLEADPVKSESFKIRLKKPIILMPNIKHHIKVDFTTNAHEDDENLDQLQISYAGGELKIEPKDIGENTIIEFHDHPYFKYDAKFSMISQLHFNRMPC